MFRFLPLFLVFACSGRGGRAFVRIPSGTYEIGCMDPDVCPENPIRTTTVAAFLIGKYEVTLSDYRQCVRAGACPVLVPTSRDGGDSLRVLALTWSESFEYCRWRGGRPPTNEEWEIAARGRDARVFPWGNIFEARRVADFVLETEYDVGRAYFRPGEARAGDSPFGVSDMAGTLPEFTTSQQTGDLYIRGAPSTLASEDPMEFSAVRLRRVARDGRAAVRCVKRWSRGPRG
jgi:formylglycine-generating enzyme required for sulfatase activity